MKSRRGFSIIEVTSAVVIMGVIGVVSSRQYVATKAKSRKQEAKIQLGLLHQGQQSWYMQHRTYTSQVNLITFPKGRIRYNVGFSFYNSASNIRRDFSNCYVVDDPAPANCGATAGYSEVPVEIDGKKWCAQWRDMAYSYMVIRFCDTGQYSSHTRDCYFKDNKDNLIHGKITNTAYKDKFEWMKGIKGANINDLDHDGDGSADDITSCETSSGSGKLTRYKKYNAYALGEVGADDYDSYTQDVNDLDIWVIDEKGALENCYDPLVEDTYSSQCDRS